MEISEISKTVSIAQDRLNGKLNAAKEGRSTLERPSEGDTQTAKETNRACVVSVRGL